MFCFGIDDGAVLFWNNSFYEQNEVGEVCQVCCRIRFREVRNRIHCKEHLTFHREGLALNVVSPSFRFLKLLEAASIATILDCIRIYCKE
mmetsp:Transcript_8302/g.13137  ORF Transcript_8302/g.13137 Transcript_8302/m.13137 type:complete len:90 (+) Transcript_8302:678-947(+)